MNALLILLLAWLSGLGWSMPAHRHPTYQPPQQVCTTHECPTYKPPIRWQP